jgi:hypothetical protein
MLISFTDSSLVCDLYISMTIEDFAKLRMKNYNGESKSVSQYKKNKGYFRKRFESMESFLQNRVQRNLYENS